MIYNDGSTSAVTDGMSTLTTGVISKYTDNSYDKSWGHIRKAAKTVASNVRDSFAAGALTWMYNLLFSKR